MPDAVVTDEFDPRAEAEQFVLVSAIAQGLSGRSDIVRRFEAAVADNFATAHAISVSSGFGALVVALSALGLRPGDKVLLTPTCPLCTVYALTFMRLVPVFCDTQVDNFGSDLTHAAARLDEGVAAMVEIPMWGYPLDGNAVRTFCDRHGIPLIMDIALAHKTLFQGRLLGSYGDLATFSTHWSKTFVTGEGGCVLTDDERLAARARRFSYPNDPAAPTPSLNYSMAGIQASLGLARLSRLDRDTAIRRDAIELMCGEIDSAYVEPLPIIAGGVLGGAKLLLREALGDNTALLAHMQQCGVPSDILSYGCRALYEFPALERYRTECPNAERLLGSITTVPAHPDLRMHQLQHIVDSLNSYRPPVVNARKAM